MRNFDFVVIVVVVVVAGHEPCSTLDENERSQHMLLSDHSHPDHFPLPSFV